MSLFKKTPKSPNNEESGGAIEKLAFMAIGFFVGKGTTFAWHPTYWTLMLFTFILGLSWDWIRSGLIALLS